MEENDRSISVTALVVVLALIFALYFSVRVAVPELPLHVHRALTDVPSAGEQAVNALSRGQR